MGLSIVFPVLGLNAQSRHLPAAPENLVAYSDMNAPGRVWLSWNSPPHPDGAGAITHHEYRYRLSGSSRNWGDWTEIPFSAAGEATELAVKSDFLLVRTSSEAADGMAGVKAADASRFSAEWSYGLDLPWNRGLLTPYSGVEMAGRSRRLRLGWRYEVGQWLSLSLDGELRETPHARPQHGLMLRTSLPW